MTIKEFSQKYEIPYYIAYNATVGLKPVASILRDKDFVEAELYRNVNRRLPRHPKAMAISAKVTTDPTYGRADRKADELNRIERMLTVMEKKKKG